MAIRLGRWENNDLVRIYVNGLPISAKVWFEKGRGAPVVKINPSVAGWNAQSVLDSVQNAFGVTSLDWDKLEELAASKPAAARRGNPAWAPPAEGTPGGWTLADAELLDANTMAHPIDQPIEILCDHREPDGLLARLRAINNLVITEVSLESGDFVLPGRLVIERKTVHDFTTSVIEDAKRLFWQSMKMAESEEIPILLIEGDLYTQQRRMTLPQITGTLSYLTVELGIRTLVTMSQAHTAYMIAKLVRHAAFGLGYDLGLRGSPPKAKPSQPKRHHDPAAFVLEGIPGISNRLAGNLLRHFGSIAAIAAASEADLRQVNGIAKAKAKEIYNVMRAGPEPAPESLNASTAFSDA
jgi:ERCC4-type nuclease